MKFAIKENQNPNIHRYQESDIELAYEFSKKAYQEFGNFLKTIVLFGSNARKENGDESDVDILMIVDDISIHLSPEVVETYRIVTEKIIADTSQKLHVTTLKLTAFWDYVRNSDPIAINILRDGFALLDTGFFDPLQILLLRGRIRPTDESIWVYFNRAPKTLLNSQWHILQAVMDLYWAVIDAAHAALMTVGEVPPSPKHVDEMIKEKLVKTKLLHKNYEKTMDKFYKIAKRINHREIKTIPGAEYDKLYIEANEFVDAMHAFIEEKKHLK